MKCFNYVMSLLEGLYSYAEARVTLLECQKLEYTDLMQTNRKLTAEYELLRRKYTLLEKAYNNLLLQRVKSSPVKEMTIPSKKKNEDQCGVEITYWPDNLNPAPVSWYMDKIFPDKDNYSKLAGCQEYLKNFHPDYDFDAECNIDGFYLYQYLTKEQAERALEALEVFGIEGIVYKMSC